MARPGIEPTTPAPEADALPFALSGPAHIKHTFDIRIDMGMENKYIFGETSVHFGADKVSSEVVEKNYSFVNYVTLSETFV